MQISGVWVEMRLKNLQKSRVPHSEISGQIPLEMNGYLPKSGGKTSGEIR